MRLISQDGTIDVPYENVAVVVTGCYIVAETPEKRYSMASYSDEEKAENVMGMLRDAYAGKPIIFQNFSEEDMQNIGDALKSNVILTRIPEANPEVRVVDNTVFRFPEDDEVEV